MFDKNKVCRKVTELNPDLGSCGTDVETFYSKGRDSWVIVNKNGDRVHYLNKKDIEKCLDGLQCLSLGIDVSQVT
jgi:hypothetical protein